PPLFRRSVPLSARRRVCHTAAASVRPDERTPGPGSSGSGARRRSSSSERSAPAIGQSLPASFSRSAASCSSLASDPPLEADSSLLDDAGADGVFWPPPPPEDDDEGASEPAA